MREPDLAALKAAFAAPEPRRGVAARDASGVLLALVPGPSGLAVLLTRRAPNLAMHPGEVSLPGGGLQPGDASPLEAALRETEEEVGIARARVEVLGHLADLTTHYGRLVCAYVGLVPPEAVPREPASREEVAQVLLVRLRALLDPAIYEARALAEPGRGERVVHYWHVAQATIWGITGDLLALFLARTCGWTPPRAPRSVAEPSELRP